jgi:hypothetical protein
MARSVLALQGPAGAAQLRALKPSLEGLMGEQAITRAADAVMA